MEPEIEEIVTESLKSTLDGIIYSVCKKRYPHKAEPGEWYKPGGIYDKMVDLIQEVQK